MKFLIWTAFLSISLSIDYVLAVPLDLPSNIDYQTVKNQQLLESSSECANANYEDKNIQSRSDEEENILHSATQKPSNEDVIFNIHDKAHYFRNPLTKRVAQGFIGMRGKKDYEKNKRRPTGFQGVRGKKFYLNYPILFTPPKRLPSGFQGMRGKKNFYQNPNITNEESDDTRLDFDIPMLLYSQKIQAFLEFLRLNEMNDKKELSLKIRDDIDNSLEDYEKMANFYNKKLFQNFDYLKGKRAPQGFQGVRGKKDVTDVLKKLTIEKRSSVGFFGMRGKKQPTDSHFFGMRGKKVPYDLRSKFVGVRGKKSDVE